MGEAHDKVRAERRAVKGGMKGAKGELGGRKGGESVRAQATEHGQRQQGWGRPEQRLQRAQQDPER